MTTWTLVILVWFGHTSGQNIVIQNLASYQECSRVYVEVSNMHERFFNNDIRAKCIEVRK